MSTLILQTALLLLGAYFLGAWLACVIRRSTSTYHADDGIVSRSATQSGLAPAVSAADQAARAPARRAEVVPVAPKIETINRPTATPVSAPVVAAPQTATPVAPTPAAPVVTAKAAAPPPVATPIPPVDSVTRFQDVLTGTQRQPSPVAPAPSVGVPAAAVTAATAAAAATVKTLTPAAPTVTTVAPVAPVQAPVLQAPVAAPVPTPPAPRVVAPVPSAAPSTPAVAAPFTIPTPGPTRTGVSAPIAAPAAAAATVTPAAMAPSTPASTVQPATTPATAADDLTRIRAVDSGLHAKLHQLGIRRYADIAAWTPADVARVSQSLGFQGRIEQENWIEQAQILSRGGETAFARRKDRGEASLAAPSADHGTPKAIVTAPIAAQAAVTTAGLAAAVAAPHASAVAAAIKPAVAPAAVAPAAATAPATAPVARSAAQPAIPARVADRAAFANQSPPASTHATASATAPIAAPAAAMVTAASTSTSSVTATASAPTLATPALGRDNLQRIGGINAEVERVLNVQGIGKYNQIASWGEKDTTRFDRLLGYEGRIARENWIEQSQILSRNGETAYSRQFDLQHGIKATTATTSSTAAPAAVPVAPTSAVSAPPIAVTPVATALATAAVATAAVAKAATTVSSLASEPPRPARLPDAVADQIRPAPVAPAPMPPTAAAPVVAAPVASPTAAAPIVTMPVAASIAAGVSTVPMAATRTGELAGLRSVRSEAYAAATTKSGPDDLKRIRGVGVLIERKLNSMGINSYAQIANWTSAEIDRVSQVLDFKGKVERENWVEQARILSAGGQTEFSRRVDRGDDMNKPK
jgi:predicted flap endonuclease-1-like 5' DNA nuclease